MSLLVAIQPVIKWTGSKRLQSEMLCSYIEKKKYKTYYEPFVGGGSMLYQILHSDIIFDKYIASDINKDLIDLWLLIKEHPVELADAYEKEWLLLYKQDSIAKKRQHFEMVRARFNKERNPYDFMFIMRTTTNGMPRYNKSGEFNNSFHLTRNGIHPKRLRKIIAIWSNLLNQKNVTFIHRSYNEIQTNQDDLLYLDPPYAHTKGIYFGVIDYDAFWLWLCQQKGQYLLSFDGKVHEKDYTYEVPKHLYRKHFYIPSGQSSFRKVINNNTQDDIFVYESLYIK